MRSRIPMMEWQNPEALYLILPCCVAWLTMILVSDRKRQNAREAFVARAMWDRILPEESRLRFWSKQFLRVVAIVASLVALAGPRFGTEIEKVIPRGSDLYVLIDVSRSMLAEDVVPSRLGRAKADVSALLNRLNGERVGLIAFAGQAVVKCPLTVDYDSFRRALQELDPSSAPRGGTAIGDAIRKALEVFQSKVDRDQAMLLITDGDDQQSYPLEAAAVAADHHVTIFTIGLGDSEQGARIPQQDASKNFIEYQGEQVWSKMDGSLLGEIALKTSGIYVPAGTKAYDLGELYSDHLQNRRAKDEATQERSRRSEQYQIFLAIAVVALLIDLCLSPYRRVPNANSLLDASTLPRSKSSNAQSASITAASAPFLAFAFVLSGLGDLGWAVEPYAAVREGLRQYKEEKYDVAQETFSAAIEELEKQKSEYAAIAAFDEACAYHRRAETEKARESYLRAGLSKDRSISIAAHFNLGNLTAEKARNQAGEQPELVEPEKRKEIVDLLMQAAASYRHCLELQPDHPQARSNLELLRQWIKYYADKWRELDRQKRRDESNLFVFLEYLIQTQTALKATVEGLPATVSADAFAELKQGQTELAEEIPTLQEKIDKELRPSDPTNPNVGASVPPEDSKELDEGITLLQSWAGAASENMFASAKSLGLREPKNAVTKQQLALDELDKIWEAVVPFHPLLAKELSEQTSISKKLNPNGSREEKSKTETDTDTEKKEADPNSEKPNGNPVKTSPDDPLEEPKEDAANFVRQELKIDDVDFAELAKSQDETLKMARLLAPKAEMELKQFETQSPSANDPNVSAPAKPDPAAQPSGVDPEEVRAGYEKAIELAPKAVEYMEDASKSLKQKDLKRAAHDAEEARKILDEIQKAQPKNKQDQQNQDQSQDKKDDQQQESDKDKDKESEQNKEQPKPDEKKPDEKKQDEKESDSKKKEDKQDQEEQQQAKMSPDRMEEALRKVRERQEEKREKDRELKAKILGRLPVDKDW